MVLKQLPPHLQPLPLLNFLGITLPGPAPFLLPPSSHGISFRAPPLSTSFPGHVLGFVCGAVLLLLPGRPAGTTSYLWNLL